MSALNVIIPVNNGTPPPSRTISGTLRTMPLHLLVTNPLNASNHAGSQDGAGWLGRLQKTLSEDCGLWLGTTVSGARKNAWRTLQQLFAGAAPRGSAQPQPSSTTTPRQISRVLKTPTPRTSPTLSLTPLVVGATRTENVLTSGCSPWTIL